MFPDAKRVSFHITLQQWVIKENMFTTGQQI